MQDWPLLIFFFSLARSLAMRPLLRPAPPPRLGLAPPPPPPTHPVRRCRVALVRAEREAKAASEEAGPALSPVSPPVDPAAPPAPGPPPVTPAPADAVASASASAAAIMLIVASGIRAAAVPLATALGHDIDRVASLTAWAPSLSPGAAGAALATAAGVTAARAALAAASPPFAAATARSNATILPNLSVAGTALWTAAAPALAEELLFRGALLPAIAPDGRGAAIAAAAFGALHVGGGRGAVFAAWATGVGLAYGGLTLATGYVWAAVAAHALANGAAGALWWAGQHKEAGGGE